LLGVLAKALSNRAVEIAKRGRRSPVRDNVLLLHIQQRQRIQRVASNTWLAARRNLTRVGDDVGIDHNRASRIVLSRRSSTPSLDDGVGNPGDGQARDGAVDPRSGKDAVSTNVDGF